MAYEVAAGCKYFNSLHDGYFFMLLLLSTDFYQKNIYIINTIIRSNCWIQVRMDRMSILIWVQTVSNGYQQMTKVATRNERCDIKIDISVIFLPAHPESFTHIFSGMQSFYFSEYHTQMQ